MSTLADAAIEYAERGMAVFPLRPRDKRPDGELAPHGFHDAATDTQRVRDWWGQSPTANIGLACAPQFLVLDEDPRSGGDRALEDLFMTAPRYGFDTLTSLTGGGGRHFVFKHPTFDVSVAKIAPGLDLKSKGYIVVPPSIHPSGRTYEWQDASIPITDVPEWLLGVITRNGKMSARTIENTGKIAEGLRNETMFRTACSLRGKGLTVDAIRAALREENCVRCSPPLPDEEIHRIAASSGRYAEGNDATKPEIVVRVEVPLSEATLEDLNRLTLFAGRLRFDSIWRRGANTFARINNGREIREVHWACDADLLSFARSQSVLIGAGVLIPSPRKGEIRGKWENAVQLILRLADSDRVDTGDALVIETEERLSRTFSVAGKPVATEEQQMALFLKTLSGYRRNPALADNAPPCVFVAEGHAWVHIPSWRAWMSTPQGYNKLYLVKELHDGLAALGFRSAPNVVRRIDGCRYQLDLWRGDIPDCLVENETV